MGVAVGVGVGLGVGVGEVVGVGVGVGVAEPPRVRRGEITHPLENTRMQNKPKRHKAAKRGATPLFRRGEFMVFAGHDTPTFPGKKPD